MVNGSRNIKTDEDMVKKYQRIIEQQKEKGNDNCSWRVATLILSKRIDKAGGLKEDI